MEFRDILKSLRKKNKVTQEELAARIKVERSSVGKYETGTIPSYDTLSRIADYFHVTVDYLLGRDSSPDLADTVPGLLPITRKKFPLLGEIACGEPTWQEEHHETMVESTDTIGADSSPAYDPDDQARKLLERELEELARQKERLYDFLERGLYDEEIFRSRMAALLEKIKASESALQTLESRKKTAEERKQFASTLARCIDILAVPSASAEATNRLLKQILRRIEYSRQRSPRRAWDPTPIELQLLFL